MTALSTQNKQKLLDKLDEVKQKAGSVDDARVRDVDREYRQLVDAITELDELAWDIGQNLVGELDFDANKIEADAVGDADEFYWENELWNHTDFEDGVSDELKSVLDQLYMFPFGYEVSERARGAEEKVDKARYALDAVRNRKEWLEDL